MHHTAVCEVLAAPFAMYEVVPRVQANRSTIVVPRIECQCMDASIVQGKSTVGRVAYQGNLQTYRIPALQSRSFQLPSE